MSSRYLQNLLLGPAQLFYQLRCHSVLPDFCQQLHTVPLQRIILTGAIREHSSTRGSNRWNRTHRFSLVGFRLFRHHKNGLQFFLQITVHSLLKLVHIHIIYKPVLFCASILKGYLYVSDNTVTFLFVLRITQFVEKLPDRLLQLHVKYSSLNLLTGGNRSGLLIGRSGMVSFRDCIERLLRSVFERSEVVGIHTFLHRNLKMIEFVERVYFVQKTLFDGFRPLGCQHLQAFGIILLNQTLYSLHIRVVKLTFLFDSIP